MRFSARTNWPRAEAGAALAIAEAKRSGDRVFDLTESNPTRCAIVDLAPLVALLGHPRGARYEPEALGHREAREAVAEMYAVDSKRVAITASTSEAYAYLFKLLCDRGDRVLVPRPSYPLFDLLAGLEDVELAHFPLVREEGFRIDRAALEALDDDRARAIVVVHPNNPTGTFVRKDDAAWLEAFAKERGMAIVADEVFAEFPIGDLASDRLPSFVEMRDALTFVLGGLSKSCLSPQLKLGWIVAHGPERDVEEAMARLEVIADTYLSVATPVQRALPEILAMRPKLNEAMRARVAANLAALDARLSRSSGAARRLPLDGGWTAIVEVPRTRTEDEWIDLLAREDRVLVQPGWFFDLDREAFLVLSLIVEPSIFSEGVDRLVARVDRD